MRLWNLNLSGIQWKPVCYPLTIPSLPGACKALQQDEEAQAGRTAPAPLSPPYLPNAPASNVPSPPLTPGTPVTPSAPSPVEGPGSSECVVCMETGVRKPSARLDRVMTSSSVSFKIFLLFHICFLLNKKISSTSSNKQTSTHLNTLLLFSYIHSPVSGHLPALWSCMLLSRLQRCSSKLPSLP